jgi:hypothetical protein
MISLDSETNQNQLNLIVIAKDTEIFLVGSKVYKQQK